MATMEYCAFENTADDMRVALNKLRDLEEYGDLGPHEQQGLQSLLRLCRQFIDEAEDSGIVG